MSIAASQTMPSPESPAADVVRLRVLIADDERLSRDRLKQFLQKASGNEVVAECATGLEAVSAIQETAPDLIFLDVSMPELDGFGVLTALKGVRLPAIIFVTAYDRFALRAFETDAVDYLLKPFDYHRFQTALRRARHRLHLDRARANRPLAPSGQAAPQRDLRPLERVIVRSSGCLTIIKTVEIDWICAADNYAELHVGGKTHLLRMTISALAQRLTENRFARISRSILVNQDRIKEIHSKSHGDYFVVLHNGTSLPGSRNFRRGLDGLLRSSDRS
jgi:two-component system LytT family response regulator